MSENMNEKTWCFNLDNENIYLEQVLVDFNDIPIFFLCKAKLSYYFCLCTNIQNYEYVVVKSDAKKVHDLLHKKITMREIFTKSDYFWKVLSEGEKDQVERLSIEKLDLNYLPIEDSYYEVITDDEKEFMNNFDIQYSLNYNYIDIANNIILTESNSNTYCNFINDNFNDNIYKNFNESCTPIIKNIEIDFETNTQSNNFDCDIDNFSILDVA